VIVTVAVVEPPELDAVIVYGTGVMERTVGVPERIPDVALMLNPAGRLGETDQPVIGPPPVVAGALSAIGTPFV
jgi:hypothetical protein